MANNEAKKTRSVNWNQVDTDLLCDLVREIGLKSVLNCRTNGTTNEIRRADWVSIAERFNSNPSVASQRNVDAIVSRYKKVMQVMRNHFALERSNSKQTGGGLTSVPKIELSGSMLELRSFYGHLLTGLPSYDCDSLPLDSNTPNAEQAMNTPKKCPVEHMDALESNKESRSCSVSTVPENLSPPCRSEVVLPHESGSKTNSSPIPQVIQQPPKQFFATNAQRRRSVPIETIEEKRKKLIDEERMRLQEFGDLRLKAYQEECSSRLDGINQQTALNLALHQKQMEFWTKAIQQIECSGNNVVKSSEQSLSVGTIISVPSTQTLASQVGNVVAESDNSPLMAIAVPFERQQSSEFHSLNHIL